MKKWKAFIALLMCMALAMPAAFAAPGDAILAKVDYNTGGGFNDYIDFYNVTGDTLVMTGGSGVYTWKVGEEDLTLTPWVDGQSPMNLYDYGVNEEGKEIEIYWQAVAAYNDGEDIYYIYATFETDMEDATGSYEGAKIAALEIKDGVADVALVEGRNVDWSGLVENYWGSYWAKGVPSCVCIDGVLYTVTYNEEGINYACAIPLDGSEGHIVETVGQPEYVTAYADGKLLFTVCDYENGDNVQFVVWDPKTDEVENIGTVLTRNYTWPCAVVYDEETEKIYYSMSGSVVSFDPENGETSEVSDVYGEYAVVGFMLPGGYYINCGYECVTVRNIDPEYAAQYKLRVNNGGYADPIAAAYYEFIGTHPDVSVALSSTYIESEMLIEELAGGNGQYDIYVIAMGDEAFEAIFEGGYMAELTGSDAIDEMFARMYPNVAEELMRNGVPVAVPLACYGYSIGLNTTALDALGITAADLPDNWYDLLGYLDELYAMAEEKGVRLFYDWSTAQEAKNMIFDLILNDYVSYMLRTDPAMGFDTPILRSLLGRLEEVDFTALGLPEVFEESDYDSMEYDERPVLFESYVATTIGDFYGGYEPLLLALTPDTEKALLLEVTVAFVNPNSENKEIAIEYIECALENVPTAVMASLCDIEVVPQRTPDYEETMGYCEEEREYLLQMLDEADEEDKASIEEMLAANEIWAQEIDEYLWDAKPAAIEWYRSNSEYVVANPCNILYSQKYFDDFSECFMPYYEGGISIDDMIKGLDGVLAQANR